MQTRVAVLTLVGWGVSGLAAAADKWIEVKTPSFTVVSNAGEKRLRQTAIEFEQVRAAYAKVWPQATLSPSKPTLVVALKNENTMKRWAPEYYEERGTIDVVSVRASGADRDYLLLRTDARPSDAEVTPNYNLYRAYLGVLLSASFERPLPVWLQNGFAEVLGNTLVHEGEILLGRPVPWKIRWFLNNPRFPLKQVVEAKHGSPMLLDDDKRSTFDAQCYVLVHYLLFGERGANMQKLSTFQQLWLSGRTHQDALAESLGDLDALEAALLAYAGRPILSYAQFPEDAALAEMKPEGRVLAPAEIAGLQAAVHVAMGRPADAQAAIEAARAADPRSPLSYDAEGLLGDRTNDEERAAAAFARAVELGSTNAYSHYRLAQLSWKPKADLALLAEQRRHLERAVALSPSYANALSFLAEVLVQLDEAPAALSAALRAIDVQPGDCYHRVALARALHALDRVDEARQSAQLGLQLARNDADRSNAERFLAFLDESARHEARRAELEAAGRNAAACTAGDASACAALVPELERTCGAGEAEACAFLGWLYRGNGLAEDAVKAAGYQRQACDAGDQNACAMAEQSP